jgi:Trk K+ transport system NAD-binding subunit
MKFPRQPLIYLRFLRYVLWEFRWPLLVFWGLVLIGGLELHHFYRRADGTQLSYPEACYDVFTLIFMQTPLGFPNDQWYLQPFFFLVPIVGLGAIADSVVRLGYLIFASKRDLPEWHRMLASLYSNHIIIVGLGKVGYRTLKGLVEMHESVVAIERQTGSEFLEAVRELGVPVIIGNGRNRKTLQQARVERARTIILATDDDLANLDAALTARDLNPAIRVVLRLFDDTLAAKFATGFAMPAISTADVSAPAFIAAATGHKVYASFQLDGAKLHMTDLTISSDGSLVGRLVGKVQTEFGVNIVMYRGPQGVSINPPHDTPLGPNDTVVVFAPVERLVALEAANHPPAATPAHRQASPEPVGGS